MTYEIRPFQTTDAADLSDLLNHTIQLGGSTAYETAFDTASFIREFHSEPGVIGTLVAQLGSEYCGFQTLFDVDPTSVAIATFADQRVRRPQVGQALFVHTQKRAREHGAHRIIAKIRADNQQGLRYYRGLGFEDVDVIRAVPLADGTLVDRIVTSFTL